MSSKNNKILIIQPILAHYRYSLFEMLVESEDYDVEIIGENNIGDTRSFSRINNKIKPILKNRKLKFKRHTYIWQFGVLKYIKNLKPKIVVLTGVDPHIISNLYIALFYRFFNIKIIWWGHGKINQQGIIGRYSRMFFFNKGKGIFTYGEYGKKTLQKYMNSNIHITNIKNCINSDAYGFNYSQTKSNKNSVFTILFSSTISKRKRLDVLIDALALLKDNNFPVRCLVIGIGGHKKIVEEKSIELQLDKMVKFIGESYGKDCVPFFQQADLFVLPGASGLSIIHSLSYGVPFITSDNLNIHGPEIEIIQPGINGDFFEGYNPASLAKKIVEWKHKIKENKILISERCIKSVKEGGYTPECVEEKMISIFRKIL
ncbi:glycosyltransferase family 4 protein [Membranihabitans maritimus]|uniref:glycosyltransferase family 4 protein n=1 Tax=Membranihabitans maritimus TaxID=2904244 RepID=UPI001F47EFD1|nr:glycosyltransferase [Membranihabitans maritimus]